MITKGEPIASESAPRHSSPERTAKTHYLHRFSARVASTSLTLRVLAGVVSLGAVIGVYWIIALRSGSDVLVPTPDTIVVTFWDQLQSGSLVINLWISLQRVLIGYLIGMSIAVILGTIAGWFRTIGLFVNPIIDSIRPIPALAYIPLVILWLGIGEPARLLIIILAAFKSGVVSTRAGMADVPTRYVDASRMLGANRKGVFWTIAIPSTIPHITAGMRVGFTTSWLALVAAELIAANGGLGYMIRNAGRYFQTDVVIVGIITIGIVAGVLDSLIGLMNKRLTRWSESA